MKVLHVAPDVRERGGGVPVAVRGLAHALERQGVEVEVLTVESPGGKWNGDSTPLIRRFPPAFPRKWGRSPRLLSHLRSVAGGVDVVQFHGLWRHPVTAGSRVLRRMGVPYIVTLHGLLNPIALGRRGWVKRPYLTLLERQTLQGASAIHCLSEGEAEGIGRFGLAGKTVVLPNGLSPEDLSRELDPRVLRERNPSLRGRKVVLYLGRIVPAKGVRLLIPALRQVLRHHPEAHLALAGRATLAERMILWLLAGRHGVAGRVTHLGLLSAEEKWDALAGADVFVLPSLEEADEVTLAGLEALSSGLPVIFGPGPNHPELRSREIVIPTAAEPASIASAIDKLLGSPERARRMGEAGRAWVREERCWDRIAPGWVEVYRGIKEMG